MAKEIVTLILYKYPYRTVSSPTLRKGKLHKTFHACQEPKERGYVITKIIFFP